MPVIHLGNPQAVHHTPGEQGPERQPLEGHQITEINLPDGVYTLREQLRTITHRDGVWAAHSDADRPTWVHCSDPELEAALIEHWGCRAGGPDDYLDRLEELHLAPRRDSERPHTEGDAEESEGG